jgi:heme/copper-type cytochrome/quinol oxidase subunit 4
MVKCCFIGKFQMDIRSFLYQKREEKAKNIRLIATIIIIILFFIGIIVLNKADQKEYIEHFIGEKISAD